MGTTLYARTWQDGMSEPNSWDIQVTDSSFASGKFGLYTKLGTSDQVQFDHFAINTPVTACIPAQNTMNNPPWTQAQIVTSIQNFYTSFIGIYGSDPAILYNAINEPTVAVNFFTDTIAANKAVLGTIRGLTSQSIIFVHADSYDQIISGSVANYTQSGLVIDFHFYDDPTWPWYKKISDFQSWFDYAHAHGQGFSIGEWNVGYAWNPQGFANNIVSLALTQSAVVAYYNEGNVLNGDNVTITTEGTYLAAAYTAILRGIPTWYDTDYVYKKAITIPFANVQGGTDLLEFPLLISLVDANLKVGGGGYVQNSNGYDIVFTDSTQATRLDHEIEHYNAATGEIEMWVRLPRLSYTTNTVIYCYFGNPGISTSQENKTGVWDYDYLATYHLQQSTGTANSLIDSTQHANPATPYTTYNTVAGNLATTGEIAGGQAFNGSSYGASAPNTSTNNIGGTNTLTLSAWVKRAASNSVGSIVTHGGHGSSGGYTLAVGVTPASTNQIKLTKFGVVDIAVGTMPADTNWHYIVECGDGSGTYAYVDGAISGTSSDHTNWNAFSTVFEIGAGESAYWNGAIDEVRLSQVRSSAGWIATEYANQGSPSTFYTVGVIQSLLGAITTSTSGIYAMNGTILDTQPYLATVPLTMAGNVLPAGTTFFLMFANASSATQILLTNGAKGNMTFRLSENVPLTGLVQVSSVLTGTIFQVVVTTLVNITYNTRVIQTPFS